MSAHKYRLATLLQLRENVCAQRRQELAEAITRERGAAAHVQQISEELSALLGRAKKSRQPGRIDIEQLRDAQRFDRHLQQNLRLAKNDLSAAGLDVERCQAAMVQAEQEAKALEKHRDVQLAESRVQANRADCNHLDEIASRGRKSA